MEIVTKENIPFSIRLGENSDGKMIASLVKEAGWDMTDLPINWNDIYPYWLVCENEGKVLGCVQVYISKPIGRLELLAVSNTLGHRERALAVKSLCYGAMATVKASGATLIAGTVLFSDKSWKRILKNNGAVVIGSGNEMVKRLV